jgi:succinyl-CoA synthetase beta subunit
MNNNYTNNTNIPNIIILEIEQFKELLFYIIKTFSCKYNIKQHICNKYIKYITKMYDINIIDNMDFTINKNND